MLKKQGNSSFEVDVRRTVQKSAIATLKLSHPIYKYKPV